MSDMAIAIDLLRRKARELRAAADGEDLSEGCHSPIFSAAETRRHAALGFVRGHHQGGPKFLREAKEIEMFLRDGISDEERDAYKLDEAKKAWADSAAREAAAADGPQTMQSIDEEIAKAVEEMDSESFRIIVTWIDRLGSLPGTPQDRLRDLLINKLMSTRRAWRAGLADAARKS